MPITDSYATEQEYRAAVTESTSPGTTSDPVLKRQLLAVSRRLTRELGQHFTKDAAVVERLYCPAKSTRCLEVDNIATATGLVIKVDEDRDGSFADETAWAATDYQLRPLNADKGDEVRPWYEIYVPDWSTKTGFRAGYYVSVTAIWGWPAVPSAIKEECIQLTRILREESPGATGGVNELQEEASMSPRFMSAIKRLRTEYRVPVFA